MRSALLALVVFVGCTSTPPPAPGNGGGAASVGGGAAVGGGGGGEATGGGDEGDAGVGGGGGSVGGGGDEDGGLTGDGGTAGGTVMDAGAPGLTSDQLKVIAQRPYRMVVPQSYTMATPTPFVMLLHGYTASGLTQDVYFKLSQLAQSRGFLLATPDGTFDSTGQRFWNATDACCDLYKANPDDVFYLTAVMDDVRAKYNVDPKRVYLMGHSNGAFMSHRLACDLSDRIAGIMALAGDNWDDAATKCNPSSHDIAILQVHGTLDAVIRYGGGTNTGQAAYPSAQDSVKSWARELGCDTTLTSAGSDINLEATLLGDDTRRQKFANCPKGAVELWSIEAGSHVPTFSSEWPGAIYDWLAAHPKP